jgi:nucleoporin NUP159
MPRAPTLDTVNRTFRNIEIALSQQSNDVSSLAARLKRVDLNAPSAPSTPMRDTRLPDRQRRAYSVTPNVAATTAAALNAERGANRLKKALFAVRKEPLLNVNVNAAKPPLAALSPGRTFKPAATPSRPATSSSNLPVTPTPFSLPMSFPKFAEVTVTPPDNSAFSLPPDDDFSLSMSLPSQTAGRRGGSVKKHSTVQLPKKSAGTPSPAPSFDWGPLPTFNTPTKDTLAASFTKK